MNTPVSIRELMQRVELASQTMRECRDAEFNAADRACIDAEDELRLCVAASLGGLSHDELRKLGAVL